MHRIQIFLANISIKVTLSKVFHGATEHGMAQSNSFNLTMQHFWLVGNILHTLNCIYSMLLKRETKGQFDQICKNLNFNISQVALKLESAKQPKQVLKMEVIIISFLLSQYH